MDRATCRRAFSVKRSGPVKPANVFIADDGHLVLGDFGLVIQPGSRDPRLTDTYENVGSRDWMPGWAMGMRMDDVRPSFDVQPWKVAVVPWCQADSSFAFGTSTTKILTWR